MFSNSSGRLACVAKATSQQTYALLYDATRPAGIITVVCKKLRPGDANMDSSVDVADIAAVISSLAGKGGAPRLLADVNGDGIVDVADIATIISIMAGKE